MVAQGRLELPTLGLWILRSNRLSYWAILFKQLTIYSVYVKSHNYFLMSPVVAQDFDQKWGVTLTNLSYWT